MMRSGPNVKGIKDGPKEYREAQETTQCQQNRKHERGTLGVSYSDLAGIGDLDAMGFGYLDFTGVGDSNLMGVGDSDLMGVGDSDLTGVEHSRATVEIPSQQSLNLVPQQPILMIIRTYVAYHVEIFFGKSCPLTVCQKAL